MEAKELRKKTNELEKAIQELTTNFVNDVGPCDITIETNINIMKMLDGSTVWTIPNVKIQITV